MKLHITHAGRRYRLFKRSAAPGSSFYLYFEQRGERILKSTGCADAKGATKWARAFLEARSDKNNAAMAALLQRSGVAATSTVGQLLNWFEASRAISVSDSSRAGYANCLKLVLRKATIGQPAGAGQLEALPLSTALTKDMILGYLEAIAIEARTAPSQEEAARIRRSAASILNQAKSVFSLLTVEHAARAGIVLPSLTEFLHAIKLARKELMKGSGKVDFHPPDDKVLDATLAAWRALDVCQPDQRNTYIAMWLGLSCALRLSEIEQARWEWITTRDGAPMLDATGASVKNKTGILRVRPIEPFWSEGMARLTKNGSWSYEAGPMLAGDHATTAENAARAVADLMHAAGWRTQKLLHALRALAGSWVASQYGIFEAQRWLRHQSVSTTEKSYTVLLRDKTFKPTPIKWAGQTTETTSKKENTP